MPTRARDSAANHADQTIGRIREINDHIVNYARRSGEASLEAYKRLLRIIADAQEATGDRGAEWVRAFTAAEARFTRELADAPPAAARSSVQHASQLGDKATEQARRVPGVAPVEGEARGSVAREQDLPISNYDQLTASEIIERLDRLPETALHKVDAYERWMAARLPGARSWWWVASTATNARALRSPPRSGASRCRRAFSCGSFRR
jgi:hypothetical protein